MSLAQPLIDTQVGHRPLHPAVHLLHARPGHAVAPGHLIPGPYYKQPERGMSAIGR